MSVPGFALRSHDCTLFFSQTEHCTCHPQKPAKNLYLYTLKNAIAELLKFYMERCLINCWSNPLQNSPGYLFCFCSVAQCCFRLKKVGADCTETYFSHRSSVIVVCPDHINYVSHLYKAIEACNWFFRGSSYSLHAIKTTSFSRLSHCFGNQNGSVKALEKPWNIYATTRCTKCSVEMQERIAV